MKKYAFAMVAALLFVFTSILTSCTKDKAALENSIQYPLPANVKGLDPIQANDLYSSQVIHEIYEGLLGYHYLKRPLELVPVLAESLPEVSKDGLTHTFKIKKGVRFQDDSSFPDGKGREVTAEDFIYSWRRLADPRNRSTGYWIFEGKIEGLDEWAKAVSEGKADYSTPISGLQAPETHTLVIKLREPYYQLHHVLTMPFSTVVPREAVEKYGEEFINHPVGTGPFQLESWVRNSKITLIKSPNFRGETYPTEGEDSDRAAGLLNDAGKPIPFVDKVVFTELLEDQPRWLNFQKGNFDILPIPKDNFAQAIQGDKELSPAMKEKGMQLMITSDPDVTYVAYNMKDPVLGTNKKLRQAMSMAYDRKTSIERFYNNQAIPAQGPIPPGIDGHDPNLKNPYTEYNVEKAKQLLKEAGYEGGKGLPEFTYDALSTSTSRQMAEFYQQMMGQIGIKISIRSNSWPQFQQKIQNGESQIWGIAWGADYPDGQNFLQLFHGKNLPPGGANQTRYQNPEFDKLYEQAKKMPPGPERTRLYHEMQKIVVEDEPWMFANHRQSFRLYQGWLYNYKRHAILNGFMKYLRVDPEKRAEMKSKF